MGPELYGKIMREEATAKDFIEFALIFMSTKPEIDNDKLLEHYRKESKCLTNSKEQMKK